MPNWCNNTITIKGQTETIKQLWDDAQAAEGLLEAMVPTPKDMFRGNLGEKERQECAEQGIPNWWDWQTTNWGCKWDVSLEGLEYTDHGDGTAEISGWFDSPWSPPIEAYNTFCESMDGVYLEAFYMETGCCFVGCWDSEGGDDYYDYTEVSKSNPITEIVPKYLVDHFDMEQMCEEWFEDEEEVVEQ